MPLVQVKVIEDVFSDAQKKAMVEKLSLRCSKRHQVP